MKKMGQVTRHLHQLWHLSYCLSYHPYYKQTYTQYLAYSNRTYTETWNCPDMISHVRTKMLLTCSSINFNMWWQFLPTTCFKPWFHLQEQHDNNTYPVAIVVFLLLRGGGSCCCCLSSCWCSSRTVCISFSNRNFSEDNVFLVFSSCLKEEIYTTITTTFG